MRALNYAAACAYLDGFVNFERKPLDQSARTAISLEGVRELSERLGDPWRKFDSVHVAGTKGKGSTCAFAASILRAEGLRTGLYVSPHLESLRERISISGEEIPEVDFARILSGCQPVLEELRNRPEGYRRPTYFEILTHVAFAWFAEQRVDAAVIEVGLGGRLDATNIIQPLACAVTNISLDHTAILGNTHELIAREKAGIFKRGVPVVSAPQRDDVSCVLKERAFAAGTDIEVAGVDFKFTHEPAKQGGEWPLPQAAVTLPGAGIYSATLGLRGAHQVENWAVAVRLVDLFSRKKFGRPISEAAVQTGSRATEWPGRLEILNADAGPLMLLDGAHNARSVEVVLNTVRENLPGRGPLVCLFGCAKDKDSSGMLDAMAREKNGADVLVLTDSCNPRGSDPDELARVWRSISSRPVFIELETVSALSVAKKLAGERGILLVMGSLYLAGAIRKVTRIDSAR